MKFSILSKIGMALLGALCVLEGASSLFIADVGKFETGGQGATIVMGYGFLALAVACFAFLFSRRLAKVLGVIVLLAFAAGMVWLTFLPATPAPNFAIYRVASIALFVLLVARVASTWLAKRRQASP